MNLKYYLSEDDASYGSCTEAQIAWVRDEERRICRLRAIEVVECNPMCHPAWGADDCHPDSESIFEQAIYACPDL